MADSLRDRIAAVLQAQPPVRLQSQSDWLDWTENRADAVIRELGTKRIMTGEPYCIRCGRPHQAGRCGRDESA